jgi:hypothetical protein
VLVAPGQLTGERKEAGDQRLAGGGIAIAVIAHQQPAVLVRARRAVDRLGGRLDARRLARRASGVREGRGELGISLDRDGVDAL